MKKFWLIILSIILMVVYPLIVFASTMQFFCSEMFDNDWCSWVMTNYSTIITAVPILVVSILKLIAVFNPAIVSNSLVDQVQAWFTPVNKPTLKSNVGDGEKTI
jgi:ABC-type arginine transport system permease subunit